MKAASKIFRIFVVGMAIMSSLLVSSYKVFAQQVTESYSGYWYANLYNDYQFQNSQSQQGFADIVIITTSDYASGTIRITRFTGYDTFEYQGKYTYYSHVPISNNAFVTSDHLTGTFTDQATYTEGEFALNATQLQDILDAIDAVDSTDQNILSYLATMKTDIIASINDIDNLIDTISWIDNNISPLQYSTTFNGTLTNQTGNTGVSTIYVPVSIPIDTRRTGTLYHYKIRIDSSVSGVNGDIYVELSHIGSNGNRVSVPANIFVLHNRQSIDIFIFDTYLYWENNVLEITTEKGNVYVYNSNNLFFQYLLDTDIEYWTLKQYFETHDYYNQQNDELDQPNENLSDSVDDYVQTEDNLIGGFDNAITDNAVDPLQLPNSNPGNWGSGFTGSLGLIGHVFNMLTASATGGNAVYLLMNFSLMLGLALLIIGKRG